MKSRPGLALSGDLLGHSTSQSGFHPSELFGASDAGGLYDPSDLTSMFDRRVVASNTSYSNVSAVDTVGTILDKSQMGVQSYQSFKDSQTELAVNGDFYTKDDK